MPAISLYNGVAFKELDISDYTKEEFDFIEDNLFFILSAFLRNIKTFFIYKKL